MGENGLQELVSIWYVVKGRAPVQVTIAFWLLLLRGLLACCHLWLVQLYYTHNWDDKWDDKMAHLRCIC